MQLKNIVFYFFKILNQFRKVAYLYLRDCSPLQLNRPRYLTKIEIEKDIDEKLQPSIYLE